MKEELGITIVKTTFIISIISLILTIFDFLIIFTVMQLTLGVVALCFSIIIATRKYKKTSFVCLTMSITSIIIGVVLLFLNIQ
jgi:hypothetical protein